MTRQQEINYMSLQIDNPLNDFEVYVRGLVNIFGLEIKDAIMMAKEMVIINGGVTCCE